MFERGKAVRNLTADEVARGMRHDRILLVDVREPNETALEAFPGGGRAFILVRSLAHSRSGRQRGGVRLQVRQKVGDGLAGGAGRGAAV